LSHVVLLLLWAGVFWYLCKSRLRLQLKLRPALAALGYCLIVMMSIFWAKDRVSSISGSMQITVSTLYAIYLVTKFPTERLLVMLGWVFFFLTWGSFLFGLLLPAYGRDHFGGNNGAWQGITEQKNTLGLVMAYGVAVGLSLKPVTLLQRGWRFSILFLSLALVGLAQSREAWLVSAALIGVHFLLNAHSSFAKRSRGPVLVFCILGVAVLGAVIAADWVGFLKLLGRDATLRGRTELWAAVLLECKNHLWLGHSGTPFWGTGAANRIYAVTGWLPTSAHNGFLECLLDLGLPGLLFLSLIFVMAIRSGFKLLYSSANYSSSRLWIYLIFVITIFNNVQTTTGFPNSISWLLLVGGACILEQQSREVVVQASSARRFGAPGTLASATQSY
jgi:O-antigen ligase